MPNSSKNQKAIDEVRRKRAKQARLYHDVYTSPLGKELLEELDEQFYNVTTFVPGDPYATHINEGGRRVVQHIHQMINEVNDATD